MIRAFGCPPRLAAALVALTAAAAPLSARQDRSLQPPDDTTAVVDRIVAIVGTKAILSSQVREHIQVTFPNGRGLPTDPAEVAQVHRDMLQRLVDDELLVQQADRDTTIKVSEDDVSSSVDELIRNARARYESDEAYRRDLMVTGFQSTDEYRDWLTIQQRRRLKINRLKDKLIGSGEMKPVVPTEAEMRDWFERSKTRLEKRPATISFRQLVVAPRPSDSARARAYRQADSIAAELRKGGDFATAARRFSMDVSTRERGGSLDWVRRGEGLDPKFEETAFSLKPGVISNPVESVYGFHLIQVERAQPAEVQVRHILIMPEVDSAEADSARRLADHLHAAIRAGANFDSLQHLYHDRAEEREAALLAVDQLPPAYIQAIGDTEPGQITGVFVLESPADPLRSKFAVIRVVNRAPAGEARYEDVKEQIRRRLSEDLRDQRYLDGLRRGTYVEIRTAT